MASPCWRTTRALPSAASRAHGQRRGASSWLPRKRATACCCGSWCWSSWPTSQAASAAASWSTGTHPPRTRTMPPTATILLPWAREDEPPGPERRRGVTGCIETWVSGRAFQALYQAAAGERLDMARPSWRRRGAADPLPQFGRSTTTSTCVVRGRPRSVNVLDPADPRLRWHVQRGRARHQRPPEPDLRFTFMPLDDMLIVKSCTVIPAARARWPGW